LPSYIKLLSKKFITLIDSGGISGSILFKDVNLGIEFMLIDKIIILKQKDNLWQKKHGKFMFSNCL
jgi:hypothetical protein